jgi:hypothetical protein
METKIQWNLENLISVLKAEHESELSEDKLYIAEVFRFHDPIMRYELRVMPNDGSVQIALDPDAPIQALPFLEYGFNCCEIEIGQSAYSLECDAVVRFYEHRESRGGLRLTLTLRYDGRWYTWANTWHDPNEKRTESRRIRS